MKVPPVTSSARRLVVVTIGVVIAFVGSVPASA